MIIIKAPNVTALDEVGVVAHRGRVAEVKTKTVRVKVTAATSLPTMRSNRMKFRQRLEILTRKQKNQMGKTGITQGGALTAEDQEIQIKHKRISLKLSQKTRML